MKNLLNLQNYFQDKCFKSKKKKKKEAKTTQKYFFFIFAIFFKFFVGVKQTNFRKQKYAHATNTYFYIKKHFQISSEDKKELKHKKNQENKKIFLKTVNNQKLIQK